MIIDITREELEIELSRASGQEVKIEFTEIEEEKCLVLDIYLTVQKDTKKIYSLKAPKEKGEEHLCRIFLLWAAADGFTMINKHLLN